MGTFEAHILASGSDGNCTVIESDGEAIMIDEGLSCRRIMKLMEREGIDGRSIKAILLTHEHSDHVSGAGATARKLDVPIYCNVPTFDSCRLGQVDFRPIRTETIRDILDERTRPAHLPQRRRTQRVPCRKRRKKIRSRQTLEN